MTLYSVYLQANTLAPPILAYSLVCLLSLPTSQYAGSPYTRLLACLFTQSTYKPIRWLPLYSLTRLFVYSVYLQANTLAPPILAYSLVCLLSLPTSQYAGSPYTRLLACLFTQSTYKPIRWLPLYSLTRLFVYSVYLQANTLAPPILAYSLVCLLSLPTSQYAGSPYTRLLACLFTQSTYKPIRWLPLYSLTRLFVYSVYLQANTLAPPILAYSLVCLLSLPTSQYAGSPYTRLLACLFTQSTYKPIRWLPLYSLTRLFVYSVYLQANTLAPPILAYSLVCLLSLPTSQYAGSPYTRLLACLFTQSTYKPIRWLPLYSLTRLFVYSVYLQANTLAPPILAYSLVCLLSLPTSQYAGSPYTRLLACLFTQSTYKPIRWLPLYLLTRLFVYSVYLQANTLAPPILAYSLVCLLSLPTSQYAGSPYTRLLACLFTQSTYKPIRWLPLYSLTRLFVYSVYLQANTLAPPILAYSLVCLLSLPTSQYAGSPYTRLLACLFTQSTYKPIRWLPLYSLTRLFVYSVYLQANTLAPPILAYSLVCLLSLPTSQYAGSPYTRLLACLFTQSTYKPIRWLPLYSLTRLLAYSLTRLLAYSLTRLLAYSLTRLLAYSLTRLLAYSLTRLLAYSLTRLLAYSLTRLLAYSLTRLLAYSLTRLLAYSLTRLLAYSLTRLLAYSLTRLLAYSLTRLLAYSLTRLLAYSLTRLLAYSLTRLLAYSLTRLLAYSLTRLLAYSLTRLLDLLWIRYS